MTRPVKTLTVWIFFILTLSAPAQAVQVAFFIEDEHPHSSLEGPVSHVAISYKGKWLHSQPSKINGRLSSFPGVHLTDNLMDLGLNYVIFENLDIPDPSNDFYNDFKNKSFNIFAEWNSKTETHCSILSGKYLMQFLSDLSPTRMKFKSRIWRYHPEAQKMKGRLGMSPKEIFESVSRAQGFEVIFQSPFSTFRIRAKKLSCSAFI